MLLENFIKLCVVLYPSKWECGNGPKEAKNRVLFDLKKHLVIICCVLVQIFYLGKMFLRYWPQCFQSFRLQETASFFAC